jgi:hypothetical protein
LNQNHLLIQISTKAHVSSLKQDGYLHPSKNTLQTVLKFTELLEISVTHSQYSVLSTQYSVLSTQYSVLSTIYKISIAILIAFASSSSIANLVLCIDNGYTLAQGGKDCRRATIVKDTYEGSTIRGFRTAPSDDDAQIEAQIIREANSLACFKRIEDSGWPEKWANIPGFIHFDENGNAYTQRTKGKSYIAIHTNTGYPNCTGPEGYAQASISRTQTLKCSSALSSSGIARTGFTLEKDGTYSLVCYGGSTLIGYFNGVANTRDDAQRSLARLGREYQDKYKTKPLEYELFYNQTTCERGAFYAGKIPCLEDIAEVFEQRTSELNSGLKNRWEHFWEMLSGRTSQDGSLTATLTSKLGKFGEAILQLLDNIYTLVINQFVGSFFSLLNSLNGTPTLSNTAAHVVKLKTYADKGSGMVLIAHSQGNLFVNAAYDGIKVAAPAAKVQVVHVAPASPTLRGGYALADVDFIIRSLRQLVSGLPSVNIELPLSPNDRTGHSFEGTYLDITRNAYARVKAMITSALDGV